MNFFREKICKCHFFFVTLQAETTYTYLPTTAARGSSGYVKNNLTFLKE